MPRDQRHSGRVDVDSGDAAHQLRHRDREGGRDHHHETYGEEVHRADDEGREEHADGGGEWQVTAGTRRLFRWGRVVGVSGHGDFVIGGYMAGSDLEELGFLVLEQLVDARDVLVGDVLEVLLGPATSSSPAGPSSASFCSAPIACRRTLRIAMRASSALLRATLMNSRRRSSVSWGRTPGSRCRRRSG